MGDKRDYVKLAEQCRQRSARSQAVEDTIEWRRIADLCSRVVREHDDLSRQKIGIASVPLDEGKRVSLRRRAKAKTLPRRYG